MKVLVTGGCGFIGANFIKYWLETHKDDEVVNLDKLTYAGHTSNTEEFRDNRRYNFIHGDICNRDDVSKSLDGVDLVVHFAAESHVDRAITGPAIFVQTNIVGTQVLLDECVKNKVKHFHYVGTDEVFGALKINDTTEFDEEWKHDPRNPYAASKAGAEDLVKSYYHTYGLSVTTTNCSNNYGPYQGPEKFLPRAITNLIDGKNIPIYGDGIYVRDWLYVEDHCRAIDLVIKTGLQGESYMIGGLTDDLTNLDVVYKLLKIFGKDHSVIEFVANRPGHDRRYSINWSKIKNTLGWEPKNNFDDGLLKTVEWYKNNEKWWRPLKLEAEAFYGTK